MTIVEAQAHILGHVRRLVSDGELTQSGLARRLGLSQAHVNNLLAGVRPMTAGVGDAVLRELGMGLEDLIPKLRGPDLNLTPRILERVREPGVMRVATARAACPPLVHPGDLLLLEKEESRRLRPRWERLYVLEVRGDTLIRRCQMVGSQLVILATNSDPPQTVPAARAGLLKLVRAEVVWIGRTL